MSNLFTRANDRILINFHTDMSHRCDLCNVASPTADQLRIHLIGKKHKKMAQQQSVKSSLELNTNQIVDTSRYDVLDPELILRSQFFDNGNEADLLLCGAIPEDRAPYVLFGGGLITACKLCCNPCFEWFSWQHHFTSDLHKDNVKRQSVEYETFVQVLDGGDGYIYFFEHLSRTWTWERPDGMKEHEEFSVKRLEVE